MVAVAFKPRIASQYAGVAERRLKSANEFKRRSATHDLRPGQPWINPTATIIGSLRDCPKPDLRPRRYGTDRFHSCKLSVIHERYRLVPAASPQAMNSGVS